MIPIGDIGGEEGVGGVKEEKVREISEEHRGGWETKVKFLERGREKILRENNFSSIITNSCYITFRVSSFSYR